MPEDKVCWTFLPVLVVTLVALTTPCDAQNRGNEGVRRRWSVYEYPNPDSPLAADQDQCGRYNRSAICDPNRIISRADADEINNLINEVQQETVCPCRDCARQNRGYIIRVAIMPSFERLFPDSGNTSMAMLRDAQMYSYILSERWQLHGSCNETVLIMYARNDGMLFTLTRRTAKEKLTDDRIKNILMIVRHYFDSASTIGDGLKELIQRYKLVFQGQYEEAVQSGRSG